MDYVSFYQPPSSTVSYRGTNKTLQRKSQLSRMESSKLAPIPLRDLADQEIDHAYEVDKADDYFPSLEELLSRPKEVSIVEPQSPRRTQQFNEQNPEASSSVPSDERERRSSSCCGDSQGKKQGYSFL
jgi:hypothetical protein